MAKLSRDQKRKKKLDERQRRSRQQPKLAYDGVKYHTGAHEPLWLQTEGAIYEAFLRSERRLDDRTAAAAVESLILKLRSGTLHPIESIMSVLGDAVRREDLVCFLIQRNWMWMRPGDLQSRDDKIGVLRSILGTMDLKREAGATSFGYLRYIEKFLTTEVGVPVTDDEIYRDDPMLPMVDASDLLS